MQPIAEVSPAKRKNIKFFILGLIGVVVLAGSGVMGVGTYRAYAQTAMDNFTLTIARWLRLPAAKVNGQSISYADYAEDMRAIRQFRATQGAAEQLKDEMLSDQVLLRLASNILVAEAAERYAIQVADEDVEAAVETLLQRKNQQYAGEADAEKRAGLRPQAVEQVNSELQQLYGWSLDEYRERVLRSLVLVDKIGKKIQKDKAAEVLNEIKAGADFAALAAKYGTDGTAQSGGDLGWFSKGQMVPAFEAAAFALKKGELSGVVESPFGYHLIKLTDRRTTRIKDKTGKTVSTEEIRASHILFQPSMQSYLDNALFSARTRLYIKAHNPFGNMDQLQKKT